MLEVEVVASSRIHGESCCLHYFKSSQNGSLIPNMLYPNIWVKNSFCDDLRYCTGVRMVMKWIVDWLYTKTKHDERDIFLTI